MINILLPLQEENRKDSSEDDDSSSEHLIDLSQEGKTEFFKFATNEGNRNGRGYRCVGVDKSQVHQGGGSHIAESGNHKDQLPRAEKKKGERKMVSIVFLLRKKSGGRNSEPSELGLREEGAIVLGLSLLEENGDVEDKEADELSQEHGEGLVHRLLEINALLGLRVRCRTLLTLIISLVGAEERLLVLCKKKKKKS